MREQKGLYSMKRHVNVKHLEPWLAKLENNMEKFPNIRTASSEELLNYVRHQYQLLDVTAKVIDGSIQLVGVKQPDK